MRSPLDLQAAIVEGAVDRVRPKLMTVATTLIGLLPVMWGSETGSAVMKRIAAPIVGGLVSSTILTLIILPVVYDIWRRRGLPHVAPVQTLAASQAATQEVSHDVD